MLLGMPFAPFCGVSSHPNPQARLHFSHSLKPHDAEGSSLPCFVASILSMEKGHAVDKFHPEEHQGWESCAAKERPLRNEEACIGDRAFGSASEVPNPAFNPGSSPFATGLRV